MQVAAQLPAGGLEHAQLVTQQLQIDALDGPECVVDLSACTSPATSAKYARVSCRSDLTAAQVAVTITSSNSCGDSRSGNPGTHASGDLGRVLIVEAAPPAPHSVLRQPRGLGDVCKAAGAGDHESGRIDAHDREGTSRCVLG